MSQFGLIGQSLTHSFSASWFSRKFESLRLPHTYSLFEIPHQAQLEEFLDSTPCIGLNVTIPYKTAILPFLNEISADAKAIGAVNTLKKHNGLWTGYNTDTYGFLSALQAIPSFIPRNVLLLGNGGAAQAVKWVLSANKIPFKVAARHKPADILFSELSSWPEISSFNMWINATPVGQLNYSPSLLALPYEVINPKMYLLDLVYNPSVSPFMQQGLGRGAVVQNGMLMLEKQAEKSLEIWLE